MNKPMIYYFLWGIIWLLAGLVIFIVGFIAYLYFFGVPCWAFDGGAINNSATREVIERCLN